MNDPLITEQFGNPQSLQTAPISKLSFLPWTLFDVSYSKTVLLSFFVLHLIMFLSYSTYILTFDNQGVVTNKVHIIILYFLGLKKSLQCTSVYQLTWLQWSYCQICVKVRVAFRQTRQSIKMFQVNKIRRFQLLVSLIN